MSGKQFRPLLPATNPDSVSSDSTNSSNPTLSNLTLKRRPVNVACESCRKRKSRCNGGKPVCEMCARRGVKACSYADGDGLKQENFELKVENEQLHDLLNRIRTLSEKEAQEVFTRLRTAEDPLAVLGFIKDADLLLGDPGGVQAIISPSSHLEAAESRVLDGSRFEIPARPWTVVAADGVVSGLISSFFSWADTFLYPFIDREAFLDDMRRGQPEVAKFCSCFLVNTICASSCFRFPLVENEALGSKFLDEAKKLLDLENGRASLPTSQGLALMFTLSAYRGVDWSGVSNDLPARLS